MGQTQEVLVRSELSIEPLHTILAREDWYFTEGLQAGPPHDTNKDGIPHFPLPVFLKT